jgi:probable addiction module antidote protein
VSSDEAEKTNRINAGPAAIADVLNVAFEKNALSDVTHALKLITQAQNVKALSELSGMRREGLYRTFNGKRDPQLSRILKLFDALDLRIVVEAVAPKAKPPRPKLGRPRSNRT